MKTTREKRFLDLEFKLATLVAEEEIYFPRFFEMSNEVAELVSIIATKPLEKSEEGFYNSFSVSKNKEKIFLKFFKVQQGNPEKPAKIILRNFKIDI